MENNRFTLCGYEIEQRPDGMFNATDFLRQWNGRTTGVKQRVDAFLRSFETNRFTGSVSACCGKVDVITEKQPVGRSTKTYWFDRYLFMLFVMWVDPRLGIAFMRRYKEPETETTPEAMFDETVAALCVTDDADSRERLRRGLDYVVFGKHEPDLWEKATDGQREQLCGIMRDSRLDVDLGLLDCDGYLKMLRNIYANKINI